MPHHRLRAGRVSAVLVLAVASGTAACGPAEKTGTTEKPGAAAKTSTAAAPANGVEKLRAAEILHRARKATNGAHSLRIRGHVVDGGDKFTLDFRYAGKSKSTGWFQQGRERVEITRIGKEVYLKGNDAFWTSVGGKGALQLFSGKYLKTTGTSPDFKDLAVFTYRTALLNEAVKSAGTWRKGKAATVGGTPAVTLTTGATGDEIQVATRGEPYVLALTGGPQNRIEYIDYGKPVDVRRPPAGSVVDESAFD
ncbi:hypothetical protein HUT06_02065 [Actinomadura sp. NAK00032]|uniref:hypothetical protein n=1 Tax=Actinomadura sp. NAK00032 TaxID=2742128 RepID=UPI0015915B77|nr:hypothetical protein [Actinomadura sp. NAK00032]QKW32972.1 hypothetical protein HUT06_02065 [Actinomadura sp. NAK00032]